MVLELGLNPGPDEAAHDYALARLAWRKALSDVDVRSMAFEYRQQEAVAKSNGVDVADECLVDAWLEYQQRFSQSPRSEFVAKASTVRARKKARDSSMRNQSRKRK